MTILLLLVPLQEGLHAQDALTIGWAELDTSSLDGEASRLGVLLPKALMKATSFVGERYLLQAEASVISLKTVTSDEEKARDSVAAAQRKRDLVSISTRDPAKRAMDLRTAQASLDKAVEALELLLLEQAGIPDAAEPLATTLQPWKGHEEGILLPPGGIPALICADKKLDFLVHGKIGSVGSFIQVELILYSAATNEEPWKAAEYAAFDDLDGLVASLERPLATALAGRPFARVFFSINPEIAEILVDGKEFPGNQTLFYSQGSYLATVSAAGFRPISSRFAVVPGTDTTVEMKLEPLPTSPVFVESFPPGASLYLDGVPIGVTPLELSGAAVPRVLSARMDGFDDLRMVIRPGLELGRVVLDLHATDGLVYTDRFELAKGTFYESLGWFILSLPVTVLSYGTLNSYLRLAPLPSAVSVQTEKTLMMYYYGSQTVFWISAVASVSLATNSIVRLVRYIKAAR